MDAIDEEIIRCVVRNARSTYAEIGAAAGLSAPAAKRRLDRLVATGAVRGFTALVDPQTSGWGTQAFIEVYCQANRSPAVLRRALEGITEVVEAYIVDGKADAILHVQARDLTHLEQVIQRVRETRIVGHTETVVVLSCLMKRND